MVVLCADCPIFFPPRIVFSELLIKAIGEGCVNNLDVMTFRGLLLISCKSDSLPTKLTKIGYIAQHGKKGKKMQMKATKFYF